MRKWGCAIFMAVVACAGAPAAGATGPDVAFSDACGDNHPFIQENGISQEIPSTPRTPRFDLKGVRVAPVDGGVAVSFATCEAPGAADGFNGWRGLYTMLSDECQLAVVAAEPLAPSQPRVPRLIKSCYHQGGSALDSSDTRFDITLPADAITIAGDTLTLTVKRAGLTGEAATALAPGAVWNRPLAMAAENTFVMGAGGDNTGGSEHYVVPTGMDWANGDNSPFVVS